MDLVLIRTLVDESNTGGKKADNGWKSSALERVVEEIKKSHNMVINHDHVRSRLKTFKKQYLAVREVHKQSGFGFDYSSGLITADIEVWEDYVAVSFLKHGSVGPHACYFSILLRMLVRIY